MTFRWLHSAGRPIALGLVLALAACGSATTETPPTGGQPDRTATLPSAESSVASSSASIAGSASAAASASVIAPEATTTAANRSPYADLAQSQTPEGYQMLGDPSAPVTLMHYSDFL